MIRTRSIAIGAFCVAMSGYAALAATTVSCEKGCAPVTECKGNDTPYLFCLNEDEVDRKLVLTLTVDPAPAEGETLHVYAGNPARGAAIQENPVTFAAAGSGRAATLTFDFADVEKSPLLIVTTTRKGSSEKLLSWLPYRTSSRSETQELLAGADASGNWSVDIAPSYVQVSAGWRELPRTRDSRVRTWFSLAADPTLKDDADLDGAVSGVPGLVIAEAATWPAEQGVSKSEAEKFLDSLLGKVHAQEFEGMHWEQKPDRTLDNIPGAEGAVLRNFYTAITMRTNASVATYTAEDMGQSGSSRYFAHETSLNLKQVDSPMLWASYSQNDYGTDRHLLDLLREHVDANRPSLELGPVLRVNGDGGAPTYRAAFTLRVRPWADDKTRAMPHPSAGIVGIDVLAVRWGYGGIQVPQSGTGGLTRKALCEVLNCSDDGFATADFSKLPKGWEVSPYQASTLTSSGQVPLMPGVKSIAHRGPDEPAANALPKFPAESDFALSASLRAGALVKRGGFFGNRVDGVVPINTYAQYIVRVTVATFPGQELVSTDGAVIASSAEAGLATVLPPRKTLGDRIKAWIRDNLAISGFLVLAVVAVLAFLVPGFRQALSAFFGLIAALLKRLKDAISGKKGV